MSTVRKKTGTSGFAFPRSARLLKHAQFEEVYRQGKRHFSGLLTAFYLVRAGESGEVQAGVTVGRVFGGAVIRNRIKRRIRDAIRHALPQLKVALNEKKVLVQIVINPKKATMEAPLAELRAEMERAFRTVAAAKPWATDSAATGPRKP